MNKGSPLDLLSAEPSWYWKTDSPPDGFAQKVGNGTQLDLKSAIANRQVRNKDVQYPQQLLWLIAQGC
jgi:hypothetical protein